MTDAAVAPKTDARRWFYHWMALACLAIAVLGFMPTFLIPVAQGTFARAPIFAIHGLLFFAWTLFFSAQTWFAASGRLTAHREWGVLGVAIATAMGISVVAIRVTTLNHAELTTASPALLDVMNIVYFETCIAAALANVRQPEAHKRFMLLGTISLLFSPIGRWWNIAFAAQIAAFVASGVPSPQGILLVNGPPMIASLLIVVAMVFDWRTRRRISPIYAVGMAVQILIGPVFGILSFSPVGAAFAEWLKHLGG